MKPIKVDVKNAAAIESALAAVNGRAVDHAFTSYAEIAYIAEKAESALLGMLPKKSAPGAQFEAYSGETVANAYKYSRRGTFARLERRPAGWYLTATESVSLYKSPRHSRLLLTPDQREEAARRYLADVGTVRV